MPNVALIPSRATRIPALDLVVDGFPETKHRFAVETSEHPVEDGVLVQDHAVARSERLRLRGWVSDQRDGVVLGESRAARAAEELRRLHRETVIVEVFTELGHYPEMIVTECEITEQGAGIVFDLRLGQVLRVGSGVAGEVTADNAGEVAVERTSLVERGLLSPPLVPDFSREFAAQQLAAREAASLAAAVSGSEALASLTAGAAREVTEAAVRSVEDRVLDLLEQEAERMAARYFGALTNRVTRALLDGQLGRALLSVPGVERVELTSHLEGEGVRFRADVGTLLGAFRSSHLLRASNR